MKFAANLAGGLLGALFLFASLTFLYMLLLKPGGMPPMKAGTPPADFMAAVIPTGFMVFVKICELLGAIMVAIPRTRNIGLLFLGPIILNILAFHILIAKGGEGNPMIIAIVLLMAFLLWYERKAFAGLVLR